MNFLEAGIGFVDWYSGGKLLVSSGGGCCCCCVEFYQHRLDMRMGCDRF